MEKLCEGVKNANTGNGTEVRDELWALETLVTNLKNNLSDETETDIDQAIQIIIKRMRNSISPETVEE